MPNPKRRHSKTRTAKRRTHDALKPVPVGTCPQCQEAKAPHQVCPHCGYYKGRQVRPVEESLIEFPVQLPAPVPDRGRRSWSAGSWQLALMRIAIDAMGGDDGPGAIIDGALVAARHLQIGLLLVGDRRGDRARALAASRRGARSTSRSSTRRNASRWRSRRPRRCGASRARRSASLPRRCATAGPAALFSAGHTGASVMAAHGAFGRLPGVDRPALATIIPDAPAAGRAARLRRDGRMPSAASVQFAVMGAAYARVALGCRVAAGRAAVGRRGREQGQRADARGAPAAEEPPDRLRRQRRRARRLRGRRRRHRLRRIHRQRHAEDQRRPGRDGRALLHEELRRRSARAWATCCRARRFADSAGVSITRSTAARRWSASTVCASSGTAARRRRRCATPSRWRRGSSTPEFIDAVARDGVAAVDQGLHHDCVRVSGQGAQKVGMGSALADAFPICRDDVCGSGCGARRIAEHGSASTGRTSGCC